MKQNQKMKGLGRTSGKHCASLSSCPSSSGHPTKKPRKVLRLSQIVTSGSFSNFSNQASSGLLCAFSIGLKYHRSSTGIMDCSTANVITLLLFEASRKPKVTPPSIYRTMSCSYRSCRDLAAKDDSAAQVSACPILPPSVPRACETLGSGATCQQNLRLPHAR